MSKRFKELRNLHNDHTWGLLRIHNPETVFNWVNRETGLVYSGA